MILTSHLQDSILPVHVNWPTTAFVYTVDIETRHEGHVLFGVQGTTFVHILKSYYFYVSQTTLYLNSLGQVMCVSFVLIWLCKPITET